MSGRWWHWVCLYSYLLRWNLSCHGEYHNRDDIVGVNVIWEHKVDRVNYVWTINSHYGENICFHNDNGTQYYITYIFKRRAIYLICKPPFQKHLEISDRNKLRTLQFTHPCLWFKRPCPINYQKIITKNSGHRNISRVSIISSLIYLARPLLVPTLKITFVVHCICLCINPPCIFLDSTCPHIEGLNR